MRRLLLLICAGVFALPAAAGLFSDDEARARIEQLKAEVEALSQRVDAGAKNQVEFSNQVEAIKADIAKLRGQLEVMGNDLDTTQKRQKDFYVDLDNRLRKLESATPPDKADAPPAVDAAAEAKEYEAALTLLKSSKFRDAVAGFLAFIKNYPASSMLPSAHFWAGYGYAQLKEPIKAAEMYGKVAEGWPEDPKAPDALLEQANSLDTHGDHNAARKILQTLVTHYPASEAARKAKPRIKAGKRK